MKNTWLQGGVLRKQNIAVGSSDKALSFTITLLMGIALMLGCIGCGGETAVEKGKYSGMVRVSGSTTLLSLIQEASVRFNKANPDARVDVQGGGSSAGLMQLEQGVVEIANSSRELSGDELEKKFVDHKIAFDIISVVVNPKNPVKKLTDAQLKGIFTGRIRNWKEVGGPDLEIVVVVRDQASGTREMFDEKALGATKEKPVRSYPSAIESTSNGFVQMLVAQTPNAIGYLSFGFVDKSIKAVNINGAAPTVENAIDGKYTMCRWLHMFTWGKARDTASGFIKFVMSPEFQRDVVSREYIEISRVAGR